MFRRASSLLALVLLAAVAGAAPASAHHDRKDCAHIERPTGGETVVCIPVLWP